MRLQLTLALFLLTSGIMHAQIDNKSDLFKTLKEKDSLVFNIGFNQCDLNQFDQLISDDFEFYHDEAGFIHTKAGFINSVKTNICSISYKPRRELVEGSLEVYPLENNGVLYGAIQMGRHRFYAIEKDKPEYLTSTAKFATLWILNGDKWQMKRILSYDHQGARASGPPQPPPASPGTSFFDNADSINQWLAANHVPAVGIGIIRDGKLRDVKVFGELQKGSPAPYNTLFSIASLTKPVTAMLTLKLVSLGKWSLDEPLDKYWIDPDIRNDPRHSKLTTRIILSHQTGFANWRRLEPSKKLLFEFDPGAHYQYSGEGFEYLRRAIEHKFHMTLDHLADSLLFRPLGMHDTRYVWDDKIDTSRLARGFSPQGIMYPLNRNKTANAADLIHTTVADYGQFLAAVMNGQIVSGNVYKEMVSHQVREKTNGDKYFGLGWEVYDMGNGEYALGHGGNEEGVHTQVFLLPQSGSGLVIFTNVDDGYKLYIQLIEAYLKEKGKKIIDIELHH